MKNEINQLQKTFIKLQGTFFDSSFQPEEINQVMSGIVRIECYQNSNDLTNINNPIVSAGSGSLWILNGQYFVLTNKHVISTSYCDMIAPEGGAKGTGIYQLVQPTSDELGTDIDMLQLKIRTLSIPTLQTDPLLNLKNDYASSSLPNCADPNANRFQFLTIGYTLLLETTNSTSSEPEQNPR